MGRRWIIDVLADLRDFARENDMPLLHKQLEEAGLVAEVEIASHSAECKLVQRVEDDARRSGSLKPRFGRQS